MKEVNKEVKKEVNEQGNIVGYEDCDILTGESRDALEYNITCCEDCYRFEICINAKH